MLLAVQPHPDPHGVTDLGLHEDLLPDGLRQPPLRQQVTPLTAAVSDDVWHIGLTESDERRPQLLARNR